MNNYEKSLVSLDNELKYPPLHRQVLQINQIIDTLNYKKVITQKTIKLGFEPDQVEIMIEKVGTKKKYQIQKANNLLNNFRSFLSREYGIWSLTNLKVVKSICDELKINSVLEVMAGNAYWSKAFQDIGIEAIATDSFSWSQSSETGSKLFTNTSKLSASSAIRKYNNVDLVICCWAPNFGDSDLSVLKAFRSYMKPSSHLLFIGEKDGATNTKDFWKNAKIINSDHTKKINQEFKTFDFINEKIYEIK